MLIIEQKFNCFSYIAKNFNLFEECLENKKEDTPEKLENKNEKLNEGLRTLNHINNEKLENQNLDEGLRDLKRINNENLDSFSEQVQIIQQFN